MTIDVQRACKLRVVPASRSIQNWAVAALPPDRRGADLTVRIVDAPEGQELNERFRGHPRPTNVLSFPADVPAGVGIDLLGDIVVCAPVAIAEAQAQQKSTEAHFAHLVVHGTLHLLGFDHIADADAVEMEAMEQTILASLGFPDPYGQVGQ